MEKAPYIWAAETVQEFFERVFEARLAEDFNESVAI